MVSGVNVKLIVANDFLRRILNLRCKTARAYEKSKTVPLASVAERQLRAARGSGSSEKRRSVMVGRRQVPAHATPLGAFSTLVDARR